jgi:hypothetical protein
MRCSPESSLRDVEAAARAMGLQIQILNANTSREIDTAFDGIARERPVALFVTTTTFLSVRVVQLALLAAFHRLPSSHDLREFAEAGGLMSYGTNIADVYRQIGVLCRPHPQGRKTCGLAGRTVVEIPTGHQRPHRPDARHRGASHATFYGSTATPPA